MKLVNYDLGYLSKTLVKEIGCLELTGVSFGKLNLQIEVTQGFCVEA